jgi:hypothetical protein
MELITEPLSQEVQNQVSIFEYVQGVGCAAYLKPPVV